MKIGIDLDGVVFDSENEIRVQAELDDLLIYIKDGVVHPEGFLEIERYKWTDEELKQYRSQMKEILLRSNLMPGAKRVLDLLKIDGHELVVITARGTLGLSIEECIEQLENESLVFDKYYWNVDDKLEICEKEDIDIMIDDRASHIKKIAEAKINTLYFRDVNREKLEENEYIKEVNHWGEIYREITKISRKEENKDE